MQQKAPISELRASVAPLLAAVRHAALFGIVAGALALVPMLYLFEVYQRVVSSRSGSTLVMLTVLLLFFVLIMEWLYVAQARLFQAAAVRWDELMSRRVFQAMYARHLAVADTEPGAPLKDWQTLKGLLQGMVPRALVQLPVSLLFGTMLFVIHPLLGWVAVLAALAQALLTLLKARATHQGVARSRSQGLAARQFARRSQLQAETAEAMGMLPQLLARWRLFQGDAVQMRALTSLRSANFLATTRFLSQAVSSGLLGLAAWLALGDKLTGGPGMMVVAAILGGRMLGPLTQLMAQWGAITAAREAWGRLDALLTAYPGHAAPMPLPAPQGHLSVDDATAIAPPLSGEAPGPAVLSGVKFELKPGQALAVIGHSGSGKSCLTRLLVGLWPCTQGKVRLDGVDVFSWDKDQLGPHIGYLPQQVGLMEGTLAENVARFGEVDPVLLRQALEAAGLWAWSQKLSKGVDTPIGAGGTHLSGGQRQRVGLARALYGQPSLLVLDEPNAHLDKQGNLALVEALKQAKASGAAVVVVTHRLNLLAVCDKVLLLEEGRQEAFGDRREVMAAVPWLAPRRAVPAKRPAAPRRAAATPAKLTPADPVPAVPEGSLS